MSELPKAQERVRQLDQSAITALGFELAALLYESENKKGLKKENQRLKAVIRNLYAMF